ncbi:MAG: helix-turn-helix transcriptional regulator [Dehalobacterium sp.]
MNKNFGKELRALREKAGFESQAKLADASGVDNSTIARLERGDTKPTPETLKKIAPHLNTSYETLMVKAGHLPNFTRSEQDANINKFATALASDPELTETWEKLNKRNILQDLFKQVRDMPDEKIRRIIRYIKVVEDE